MRIILFFFIVTLILSSILGFIGWGLRKFSYEDREKRSPFECGFDPKRVVRLSFSLKFFLIAVIFLIFDVEIVLLLPLPLVFNEYFRYYYIFILLIFLLILLFGLFYEWWEGALNWRI